MHSPFIGDSGSSGGDGFSLATTIFSPSPSFRLQEFPSSKGSRGGRSLLWKLCSVPPVLLWTSTWVVVGETVAWGIQVKPLLGHTKAWDSVFRMMSSMKVFLPWSTEPWGLVVFGGSFVFSCSFFLVIHTLCKGNSKHLYNLYILVGVGVVISNLLISCVGSYLPYSIPGPPETQPMLPLTFSPTTTPKCWDLKMSKNILSLTLIYQPEDSSFLSRTSAKSMQIACRG